MNSKFFVGKPVEFQKIGLIYPPKIDDIIDNNSFFMYLRLLTISDEEIIDPLVLENKPYIDALTPFETILNLAYNQPQLGLAIKSAISFFVHEKCMILPEQKIIIIGDIAEVQSLSNLRIINEQNFFDFQNIIREACGEKEKIFFDRNEPKIKLRMDAKRRYRDQIKAKKSGLTFEDMIASICCMEMGINPLNIGEMSYAAVPILIDKYQAKEKYDIDIRSLLAGADSKKIKPEYWIKKLDK